MRILARALCAGVLVGLITGCNGLSEFTAPQPVDSPVVSVALSQDAVTLGEGSSVALQLTARDAANRAIVDRPIVWSSSNDAVAQVSAAGLVTAVGTGTAQISGSVDGRSALARVTVTARTVASVQIAAPTTNLLVGGFAQFQATTLDETGAPLTGRPVFWGTSNSAVAVVDVNGLVTGLALGTATVTATSEARTAAVGITVSPVPVATVQISPIRDTIVIGQATQLVATPRDSTGARLDNVVTWLSSSTAIATVSSSGLVLGGAAGTATITATSGGKSGVAVVVVQPRPVGAVIISPSQSALTVGQSVQLTVQVTDNAGNLLTGRPIAYSSSNANVAQVSSAGLVTASAPGNATVTVTSEGKVGTATITVSPSPVASVRIEPTTATLQVGETIRLNAIAVDANGAVVGQRTVTWTSGAPSVVSVSANGTVQAIGPGTALVFATIEGRLASATVTVPGTVPTSVSVAPANSAVIIGQGVDLTATLRDQAGQVIAGALFQWTSSNPSVAVVSSSGRVQSVALGNARIDATSNGRTGSSNITVVPIPVTTVTVNLTAATVLVGQTTQATAVARGASGVVLTGRVVTWSSANPAVATVSQSGVVTAVSLGTSAIRATVDGVIGSSVLSVVVGTPTNLVANSAVTQSAAAGTLVAAPPSVKVTDSVGTPVAGVSVAFAVAAGAGVTVPVSPASVITDAAGVASLTSWRLDSVAGTNRVTATVNGLTGSPIVFSAAGTVGAPGLVAANSVVTQSATVNALVAAPPSVKVTDNVGNPVSGVAVTFTVTSGAGTITPASPATINTNASGIATLTSWRLGLTAGANAVSATVAAVTGSPVIFNATGTVGAAVNLIANSVVTQSATIGTAVSAPPSVRVTDVGGNGVSGVNVTFALLTGGGTITPVTPATVVSNASGVATLTSWVLGTTAGSNTVSATSAGLTGSPLTFTANGIAGSATTIAARTAVTQSAVAGTVATAAPSVLVTDVSGNPVSGVSVTFTVTAGNGVLAPASPAVITTNASGIATLTSWTLGTTAGTNTVTATAAGLTGSPVVFTATGIAGAPTQLVVFRQPAGASNGSAFVTQPIVQIRDANNNLTTSTASVSVVVAAGTGTLSGTMTIAAVNGAATFTNLAIAGIGPHQLTFSTTTPALTVNSASFTVTAGDPKNIAGASVLTQSSVAGTAVAAPPSVLVTDGDNNPVSGVAVTFTVTAGNGVTVPASPASVLTNASGIATLTSWTLGPVVGANTVTAAVNGLTGSPVTFNATGTVGAAAQLVLTIQPGGGVSGAALTTQPVLEIQDANGNRTASTAAVTVVKASGTGTLGGTLSVNAVNGVATFTNLAITGTGAHTLAFSTAAPALNRVSNVFTVTAGAPTTMAGNSVLNQSATAGTAVATPPSVLVTDAGTNPVSGVTVTFAVTGGGGNVTPTSVVTNASGIATVTSWTLGNVAGPNSVTATVAGLTGSPVTFTATGTVGAASTLVANSTLTQSSTVSTAVAAPPSVKVTDAGGNGVAGINVTFTVASGGGTSVPASPAVIATNASGVATLTSWTLGATAGANTVSATATGLSGSPITFTATATAGTPTTIAAQSVTTQSAVAGSAVAAPPSVRVSDGSNNPVSGVTVTFAVASGGGVVTPLTVNTNASGIATVTSWTLGTTAGANSVTATVAGLTGSPVTFNATGTVGAAAQLAVTTQPSGAVSGAAFTTQPVVAIRDANGNLTTSTATVTASLFSGTGALLGTAAVNAVSGVATFTNLQINTAGAKVLAFTTTTPALTVNSASFTVAAGAATTMTNNSTTTQSAVAGTAVTTPPSVLVTDGLNPVSGVNVTFTVSGGGGTTSPASPAVVATNASGIATLTSWTLGATAGANAVTATSAGLTGSPLVFNATGTVGAPAQLVVTTQPSGAVSGAAFTTQPVVAIRDANGNLTSSTAAVTATLFSGTGALLGTASVNAVSGVATFTNLQINVTGAKVIAFTTTTPALTVNSASFTVAAGAPTQLVVTTEPGGAADGVAFTTQPVIEIRDAQGNRTTSTAEVTVAIATGTGTLSGTTAVNAVNGVATFAGLAVSGTGAHTLQFTTATPALSVTSSSFTVAASLFETAALLSTYADMPTDMQHATSAAAPDVDANGVFRSSRVTATTGQRAGIREVTLP